MADWQQSFVTVASAISAVALNALWQDALLVLCVWLLLRAWPRVNAATRHLVWGATLVGAFILPVATTLPFFAPAKTATASRVSSPIAATRSIAGSNVTRPAAKAEQRPAKTRP